LVVVTLGEGPEEVALVDGRRVAEGHARQVGHSRRVLRRLARVQLLLRDLSTRGANPTTFEFTTTTPALW
jgi:hypothetical protein